MPQPHNKGDHDGLKDCWGIFDTLCKIWSIIFRGKHRRRDPCVYIPERVSNRPDPCIYSQFMLMELHMPVTWENPDVSIFLGGVKQYTYNLTANTEYDVVITVHNSSHDKEARGTHVSVRWIEFGAGGQIRHPVDELVIDVPVWPGVSTVSTSWRTPATPGHYCIEVQLSHPKDANLANNLGWNNTQVYAAASRAKIPIRIFNRWLEPPRGVIRKQGREEAENRREVSWNLVEVTFDSYIFHDAYGKDADPVAMFGPRAPAWPASVEPRIFHFSPGETYRDVTLIVDAPDGPSQSEKFNVTAHQGGIPLGGVTVMVLRK
jgi:hypothetical protein